jgi:ABC-type Fe3+-hydroxamate transport system substrate-binding protein
MKKIIMLILALVLAATLVACENGGEETTAAPDTTAEVTAPAATGYKVTVTDKDGNPIAGVPIQMCDSNTCRIPAATGADGTVTFNYDPSDFHVLIPTPVDGYAVDTTKEYFFENGGKELTIVLEKN